MTTTSVKSIDWQALIASLVGVEPITAPTQVAKLSQDYYTFSQILQTQLAPGKMRAWLERSQSFVNPA